jgi:hypothetical protein
MDTLSVAPVSALGVLFAVLAVVAGGPLFARGRRVLRLRDLFRHLTEHRLDADSIGPALVRGRVLLEGPMFSPLTGQPCAGFELRVRSATGEVGGVVRDLRPFRLAGDGAVAQVVPERARWHVEVTGERRYEDASDMPARVRELVERCPEGCWLIERGGPLVLVEHALLAGSEVSVMGVSRRVRLRARVVTLELAATGTDGAAWTETIAEPASASGADLCIDGDVPMGCVVVSSRTPDLAALQPRPLQTGLVLLGPALTMAGLLILARAASSLVAGRF